MRRAQALLLEAPDNAHLALPGLVQGGGCSGLVARALRVPCWPPFVPLLTARPCVQVVSPIRRRGARSAGLVRRSPCLAPAAAAAHQLEAFLVGDAVALPWFRLACGAIAWGPSRCRWRRPVRGARLALRSPPRCMRTFGGIARLCGPRGHTGSRHTIRRCLVIVPRRAHWVAPIPSRSAPQQRPAAVGSNRSPCSAAIARLASIASALPARRARPAALETRAPPGKVGLEAACTAGPVPDLRPPTPTSGPSSVAASAVPRITIGVTSPLAFATLASARAAAFRLPFRRCCVRPARATPAARAAARIRRHHRRRCHCGGSAASRDAAALLRRRGAPPRACGRRPEPARLCPPDVGAWRVYARIARPAPWPRNAARRPQQIRNGRRASPRAAAKAAEQRRGEAAAVGAAAVARRRPGAPP